jgi:restriction endonuclease Mrr
VMTLAQARKYAPNRKIKLEAVQPLHGAATVVGALKSIFVTTSAYEKVAKRFAARTSG